MKVDETQEQIFYKCLNTFCGPLYVAESNTIELRFRNELRW